MADEKKLGLDELLKHMDKVLEKAKAIYDLGESCAVYFRVEEYYEIPELAKKYVETEINKRDSGTPKFEWWHGFLYSVTINNPWG